MKVVVPWSSHQRKQFLIGGAQSEAISGESLFLEKRERKKSRKGPQALTFVFINLLDPMHLPYLAPSLSSL